MESTKQHPLLAGFKFMLTLSVILSLFWVCNSCNQKKEETSAVTAPSFKMNCVIITKTQLQTWVDQGWFDSTKGKTPIKKILLQFYSTKPDMSYSNNQLIAWGAKTYTSVPTDALVGEIDAKCVALPLTDTIILANNYVSFKKLGIFKTDGTFIDNFAFIRIRPVQDKAKTGYYIVFETETVIQTKENGVIEYQTLSVSKTDPCPKYCPEESEESVK